MMAIFLVASILCSRYVVTAAGAGLRKPEPRTMPLLPCQEQKKFQSYFERRHVSQDHHCRCRAWHG